MTTCRENTSRICIRASGRRRAASGDQNTSAPRSRAMQRFICTLVGMVPQPPRGGMVIVTGSGLHVYCCGPMLSAALSGADCLTRA